MEQDQVNQIITTLKHLAVYGPCQYEFVQTWVFESVTTLLHVIHAEQLGSLGLTEHFYIAYS